MKKYIEIDKSTFPTPFTINPSGYAQGWNTCLNAVLQHKVIDVAPVVHGKWIPIISYFYGKPTGRYYCSVCHRVETMKGIYCRLCGAKMDGGNSNGIV